MSEAQDISSLKGAARNAALRVVSTRADRATPEPDVSRLSDRVQARSELIRAYAGRLGLTTATADVQEALRLHQDADGGIGPEALLAGARAAGLLATVFDVPSVMSRILTVLPRTASEKTPRPRSSDCIVQLPRLPT